VEFGLILPVLLLIVGGVVDFGMMYFEQIELANAARDGVRQVVVNQASGGWSQTDIEGRIKQAASPLNIATPVTLLRNGATAVNWYCKNSGEVMTVTVAPFKPYDYTILKFVPGLPKPTLRGTASMTCG
jgi:Flp pilus assembly protein TadG